VLHTWRLEFGGMVEIGLCLMLVEPQIEASMHCGKMRANF
jgi:hypothetical protein